MTPAPREWRASELAGILAFEREAAEVYFASDAYPIAKLDLADAELTALLSEADAARAKAIGFETLQALLREAQGSAWPAARFIVLDTRRIDRAIAEAIAEALAAAPAAVPDPAEAMRDRCLRIAEQEKALAVAAGFVPWSREEGYHAAAERIEARIRALAAQDRAKETG